MHGEVAFEVSLRGKRRDEGGVMGCGINEVQSVKEGVMGVCEG